MISNPTRRDRILGGLWGVAVGDALGVPVEFCSPIARQRDPVTNMRGYGTYNQPPGTWSDDTSLTLCTADTLLQAGEDYEVLGNSFVRWINEEIWTPHGSVFDVGNTTADAIGRIARGATALAAGRDDEQANGNGSLMRMAPVAMWFADQAASDIIETAHRFSALTHRHARSQIGCALFCLTARHLLQGGDAFNAIGRAWAEASVHYHEGPLALELRAYSRIANAERLQKLAREEVTGSGYVVESLESSLWCLLNSANFMEAVLKAVNLGNDADTTAAITGALAGIRYGFKSVPMEWVLALARHADLDCLFNAFAARLALSSAKRDA
jgi:ADP-ribosyl-[dinitrogen reductase] hydrolase